MTEYEDIVIDTFAFGYTDTAFAKAIIAKHKHEIRYAADVDRWLWWNFVEWEKQGPDPAKLYEFATEIAIKYRHSADFINTTSMLARDYSIRCLSFAGIHDAITLAQYLNHWN